MNLPKISIIIPVYNTEKYLSKCFDSIINQTYSNWELFIVDDGSTDKSPQICDRYAKLDERIKVIHKNNEGQGIARNVALDISTGDYIMFVDSDDCIVENTMSELVDKLAEKQYDIIIFDVERHTDFGKSKLMGYKGGRVLNNNELMKVYLYQKISTGPAAKLFKSHLFKQIRFPSFRACEDAYIMHRLLGECNKALIIPNAFYIQNVRIGSTEQSPYNSSKLHKLDSRYALREYIEKNYPEFYYLVVAKPAKIALLLAFWIVRDGCMKKNKNDFKQLINVCKEERQLLLDYKCTDKLLMKELDLLANHYPAFIIKQYAAAYWYRLRRVARFIKHKII